MIRSARPPPSTIHRVLVLYRKTTFQTLALERRDANFLDLLERKDTTVRKMEIVHRQHVACLERVQSALESLGLPYTSVERSAMRKAKGHDLIVTVGGDGTFLSASHHVLDVPVLGVVSSDSSVGHFCGGHADNIQALLEDVLRGRVRPIRLQRLQVTLGDQVVPELALNEVLFCHKNPASTSRYFVSLDGHEEEQKSSGVWIATAAGSTAAIGSAGGRVLPPGSRRIQYLVREPYYPAREHYKLLRGFVTAARPLVFASKMDQGQIFIDGPHISYPFGFGERLRVETASHPLVVYAMGGASKS